MFNLKNNPILKSYQIEILQSFFQSPVGQQFYLTGGTALSAFYLGHRDSKDFDFFTNNDCDFNKVDEAFLPIAQKMGVSYSTKVRSQSYSEAYLENKIGGWIQRLDFVRDIPRHFGKITIIDGIKVDSLQNIASNKINAVFGRLEPKDYVDLYFIIKKTSVNFDKIFREAQQKDLGINEFYLANIISAAQNMGTFPVFKIPFDPEDFKRFYSTLSRNLLLKIKPKVKLTDVYVYS